MKLEWTAATAAALLMLSACGSMAGAADAPSLEGTGWVLSSLEAGPAVSGAAPTARFEGGRVFGTDGCNRYSAPVRAGAGAIEVGPRGISTQMACEPERMKLAEAFMGALTGARRYRVSDGRLQLLAADGKVVSTFVAQSAALAGTSWRATAINNGRQAVVGVADGTTVTMDFAADGKVSGTAGCNRYMSTWKADGASLRFTAPAATRMACAQPGVMEQEQAFLKALETVTKMVFEGDRLDLRTAADALAVTLNRAP